MTGHRRPRVGTIQPPAPPFCDVDGCDRNPATNADARPFDSPAARGSHKRRRHGIASLAQRMRRPPGGAHPCPTCSAEPYFTAGGLGTHRRNAHGWRTDREDSIARRQRRAKVQRSETPPGARTRRKPLGPPPFSPATTTHAPAHPRRALSITQKVWLRLRLLYVVNGTWARELDAPPAAVRDEIARLCASNFAMPKPDRRNAAER